MTEVVSDRPSDWRGSFEDEIVRIDVPNSIKAQLLEHVVYMRREARES